MYRLQFWLRSSNELEGIREELYIELEGVYKDFQPVEVATCPQ
jgi:hypothetical protein